MGPIARCYCRKVERRLSFLPLRIIFLIRQEGAVLSEFYSRMDMPEAKGVSPIFSRSSADRRTDKAVLLVLGIYIKSHDFSLCVNRNDPGRRRFRDVDCCIDALAQDEAMFIVVAIDVESYNLASVVDPLRHGEGRAGHVERRIDAFAQQETVAVTILVHVGPYYLSRVIDPEGHRPQHRVPVGRVNCGENALAPDEGVTYAVAIPVTSHDLALRVEEAALRFGFARPARLERGEDALLPDEAVNRSAVAVGSSEPAGRVDPVDGSDDRHVRVDHGSDRAGEVNRGEDAFIQYEAMENPVRTSKLSCHGVRAIRVDCCRGRTGHVNVGKDILSLRQFRDTQNQAQHNSRKCFP